MGNAQLQQRKDTVIAKGQSNSFSVYVEKAENAEIWDTDGKRYIDMSSGIAVLNTGHRHPKVIAAVKKQLEKVTHTCFTVLPYEPGVALAEKVNKLAPGNSPKKSAYFTTGAEAVENCIKVARSYTKRSAVICFNGAFHGRTLLTMGLTGKLNPYKATFGPFPNEIYRIPYPIDYLGITIEDSFKALDILFSNDVAPTDVAAIIIEPVQGEGGFYPAPVEFLQKLRTLCDTHGIMLVIDEIQTGFARTGKMFACEYAGIEPDLMTMAKGLTGGFPLSGIVGKAEIMDCTQPGSLGGTFGGSAIGFAAANAVLEVMEEEKLCDRALWIGEKITTQLHVLQSQYPDVIGDVRNLGAMIAIEFVHDADASKPNPTLTKAIAKKGGEEGLILLTCGVRGNVIRFLPALTIPEDVLDEGMALFASILESTIPA